MYASTRNVTIKEFAESIGDRVKAKIRCDCIVISIDKKPETKLAIEKIEW